MKKKFVSIDLVRVLYILSIKVLLIYQDEVNKDKALYLVKNKKE